MQDPQCVGHLAINQVSMWIAESKPNVHVLKQTSQLSYSPARYAPLVS